jgi:hypothetical protein
MFIRHQNMRKGAYEGKYIFLIESAVPSYLVRHRRRRLGRNRGRWLIRVVFNGNEMMTIFQVCAPLALVSMSRSLTGVD